MARRIANTQLQGRGIDIINVIRQNASYAYQSQIPAINDVADIPHVGEALYGNPTLSNEFVNALVNRVGLVMLNSATFNNPYADLKKGFLAFGDKVEDIFIKLAKVQEYSAEKAGAREFKRTIPDVLTAFHAVNWRVLYPVTIQKEDLRKAFLSEDGVENLINDIIAQVYTAHEYDEFLLFKYLIIKAVCAGKMKPVAITGTDVKNAGVAFRGTSNKMEFMLTDYNEAGVLTNAPKSRQHIFMDATFNAQYDIDVLASAFNFERADFIGRLRLIDDFTTFDNERWSEIRANSEGLEAVTASELALMAHVKAVLTDEKWFQIYDNESTMTETAVSSGLYWNYFFHSWKVVSHSPFANAVVFVDSTASVSLPATITATVADKAEGDNSVVFSITADPSTASLVGGTYQFVQTQECVTEGIAVKAEGTIIMPADANGCKIDVLLGGKHYTSSANALTVGADVGDAITLTKQA